MSNCQAVQVYDPTFFGNFFLQYMLSTLPAGWKRDTKTSKDIRISRLSSIMAINHVGGMEKGVAVA